MGTDVSTLGVSLIGSMLGLASQKQDNSAAEAREKELQRQETEERQRERDKLTDARDEDRRRAMSEEEDSLGETLITGARGLLVDDKAEKKETAKNTASLGGLADE